MLAKAYALPVDEYRGEFARLLGELLHARGMSQAQLARAVGLSDSQITRYLRGALPEVERLADFAAALGVDPSGLHRAYAVAVGLKLEALEIQEGDTTAVVADWPDATPEARAAAHAAAKAAAKAVIESFSDTELPE